MINYYEVLGLQRGCSAKEIKRSFRKKAKELHPDLHSAENGREDKMRLLLAAYQVLCTPEKRYQYDQEYERFLARIQFDYREYLKSHKSEPQSQAKLIFHDLINSSSDEAVELYESLQEDDESFDLGDYLDHEDHMDCLFLLAEAFERRKEYIKSYDLYKRIYLLECERPYFRHFIEEVIERLRNITCFKMAAYLPPQEAIQYIQDLIFFNFTRKDNAFFYKKLAEIYSTMNKKQLALHYLRKGLTLDRKLPGVKKLKEKIGYTEARVG